jgi:predicted deacetylase
MPMIETRLDPQPSPAPPLSSTPALCIALHDVAPQTWPRCERWLEIIRAISDIPVTLLVVPHYHHHRHERETEFEHKLSQRLARGDDLALHGYSHLDEGPAPYNIWNKLVRRIYTRGEGEFYQIDTHDAKRRLQIGVNWFQRNGWPITGFVAPAWLLGKGGWQALRSFPFQYTTTMRRFYLLPEQFAIQSQSIVYSVGSTWRRQAWCIGNSLLYYINSHEPVIRIGLHPDDVLHPEIVRNAQALISKLLVTRTAMTKIAFANMWRQVVLSRPMSQSLPIHDLKHSSIS